MLLDPTCEPSCGELCRREPERSSELNPSDEENSRGPVNGLVAARVRERSERAGKTFEKRSGDMGPNTSGCIRWRPTTPAPCAAEVARKLSSDRVMTWSVRIERSRTPRRPPSRQRRPKSRSTWYASASVP